MVWDVSMPSNFTDGQVVDEGDLDPVVNNINWVRYATVFQAGQRRTTAVGGITTSETIALQAASTTLEAGQLYKVEGSIKWTSTATATSMGINVREGAGLAGAAIQSFGTKHADQAGIGYMEPFTIYVKNISTTAKAFTVGVYRLSGAGTLAVVETSWMAVLRSGDNALMTDI